MFFLYAGLTGLVFSILLDVYTTKSVVGAFAGAAGVFGGMAIVGYTTKTDLTRFRGILFGALIGIVARPSPTSSWAAARSTCDRLRRVLIFSGLTAYDMQRSRRCASAAAVGRDGDKLAIFGALRLYLDFINLFISLLRIFGGARR